MPILNPRRGRVNILSVLLLLALVGGSYVGYAWVPVLLSYWDGKESINRAASKWYAAASEQAGRTSLDHDIAAKGLNIDPKTQCEFTQQKDNFTVWCAWEEYAYYPGTKAYKTFPFSVTTTCSNRGACETE
jgi:hypothetical protein